MIGNTTLQILNVQRQEWTALSLADQIKLIKKKLILIHPDRNKGQETQCKELIEYWKYLRKEDNDYLKTYLPEINSNCSDRSSVYSKTKPQESLETAKNFFADFKNKVRIKFKNNWALAYNSIFIVKNNNSQILSENVEFRSFNSDYKFHILKLAQQFETIAQKFGIFQGDGSPQEHDFDNALAFIYNLIRYEDPFDFVTPTDILPPHFLEDENLSLKIYSFCPGIVNTARFYGFPKFWQDENFWLKAIQINSKVFNLFNNFFEEEKNFLTSKLAKQFDDKDYMSKIISRNPRAVYFLSDSLKYDVELLSQAIGGLSYSNFEMKNLSNLLPQEMRSINSPLAASVLNKIDLGLLFIFENTNPNLYFQYVQQACCTLDTTLQGNDISEFESARSMFLNSLPKDEQDYAKTTCVLVDKLSIYQEQLSRKMKSQAYCFFPYKLKTYTQAVDELKKFLEGNSDVQNLNKFLPNLYSSSLRSDIEKWLSYQTINPILQNIEFEPKKLKKLYALLTSTNTLRSLLVAGYIALLCNGVSSIFLLSVLAVLCLMVVQKVFYDNDDRNFIQPKL